MTDRLALALVLAVTGCATTGPNAKSDPAEHSAFSQLTPDSKLLKDEGNVTCERDMVGTHLPPFQTCRTDARREADRRAAQDQMFEWMRRASQGQVPQ